MTTTNRTQLTDRVTQRERDRAALARMKELEARLTAEGRLRPMEHNGRRWLTNNPRFIADGATPTTHPHRGGKNAAEK